MKVILKQDVKALGFKDDVVAVKNGYANNFLIPKGMASVASESNMKVLAETFVKLPSNKRKSDKMPTRLLVN